MPQSPVTLLKESLRSSLSTAVIILKFVVPLYIVADVLLYYDLLRHVSFLFAPITGLLHLPPEASIALAGGILLNVYAGIAFAAPLGLTAYQWTTLAIFLGVCHALVVESAIMKKLGVAYRYSIVLRLAAAFIAVLPLPFLPDFLFSEVTDAVASQAPQAQTLGALLVQSIFHACILALKIVCMVSGIIVCVDLLKATPWIQRHIEKVNTSFSIIIGQLLGITYGASLLIREARRGNLSKGDIFYISTFLMVCHSVIEDVLLFVIFGANLWVIVSLRLLTALLLSSLLLAIVSRFSLLDRIVRVE